jgi:acetolactate synthase-1/2/3 large subunit
MSPPATPIPTSQPTRKASEPRGYRVNSADDLLPVLTEARATDTVSVIACPVNYSENLRLTGTLGELSGPF